MSKEQGIKFEVDGEVISALPNTQFKVLLDKPYSKEILTTISGKMRYNNITILLNDKVRVEMSAYDLTRGRIIRRLN